VESWRSLTARPFATLNQVVRYCIEQSALLFLFALPGLLAVAGLLRSTGGSGVSGAGIGVAALLLAGPLAMGALAPVSPLLMQEGRYVAHLLVAFFIVSAVGVAVLARAARYPPVVWALAVLALVRLAAQDLAFADRHARQVDNINRMHVEMGRWLAAHSTPDAVIATNDIGAIAFFSNRRILDMEGLTTPAILPFKTGGCHLEYLRRERPDLVVIFDEWYPHVARRTDLLREIHRITVPRVTAAHDTLKVYRPSWALAVPDPACPRGDRRDTAHTPSAAAASATASSHRRAG
jgi:hypothetical protein